MYPVLKELFSHCEIHPLYGGDINQVFLVSKKKGKSVIKVNSKADFPNMFEKEAKGLKLLSEFFLVPEIIQISTHENWQYLELSFHEKTSTNSSFWSDFANNLSKMHQKHNNQFGFEESNFMGSLVQNNEFCDSWESFLIEQRLAPMIEMAVNCGEVNFVESKIIENFYKRINELFPKERPTLVHGDLWSGNFISSDLGPVLIDPAVYYGHREMDIGMMHLFGGFDPELFKVYNEIHSLEKDWEKRMEINQLYPLLVHLNLFGRRYWDQVLAILKPFS